MTTPEAFDPSRFLTLVSGKEYLEVKWRLVWLRSEHPEAAIDTDLISHANNEAVFTAKVSIPDGGSATGWGSEDAQGFGDYLEKAETKAIGRALAALGYGTQFAMDHEYGPTQPRQNRPPANQPRNQGADTGSYGSTPSPAPQRDSGASGGTSGLAATDRQRGLIQALAREQKISGKALDDLSREQTGAGFGDITRQQASAIIEHLREPGR